MAKIHLPILLSIFVLFFSGATPPADFSSSTCQPFITLWNVTGIRVKALEITNTALGTTETLPNPTFPYIYKASGTDLEIKLCFEYPYSGNLEMPGVGRRIRFDDSKTATLDIKGVCNAYDIYLMNEGAPEDAY